MAPGARKGWPPDRQDLVGLKGGLSARTTSPQRRRRLVAKSLLCLSALVLISIAAWKPLIQRLIKNDRWFIIVNNIAHDSLRRIGAMSGQIGLSDYISPPETSIGPEVSRMHLIYNQYLQYLHLPVSAVRGKRILELGPGLTMSAPLLFMADGASHAAGVDKFVPFQDTAYYQHFYLRLRETLDEQQKIRFDAAIRLDKPALNSQLVTHIYGRNLPDVVNELKPGSWDLVVSNAVIEEIYDPTPFFRAQDQLLRPGGAMVHAIDLRDYGMFTKHGFHPLEFLTVPDWAYRWMVEASGQPARRMTDYYRNVAQRLGYQTEISITRILGHKDPLPEPRRELRAGIDYTDADLRLVSEIRPRLQPQFSTLPDADLLAASIIFAAWKPAVSKSHESSLR
jgi:SAM-dependent methyltransferase